jgi:phage/plasmid primase-like uncharacterized protein
MNPKLLIHIKNRLRTRVKIASKIIQKTLNQTKKHTISSLETSYFYAKEIKQQAKVFKNNIITNQINKYDYDQGRKDYSSLW